MTITALAATLALGAVPALAQEDGSRNARAQGAPGFFCKQAGAQPGSPPFKACVQLAAKARGQAQNGDGDGGDPNARSKTAPGRFCQANGAALGSEAFRSCVRTAGQGAPLSTVLSSEETAPPAALRLGGGPLRVLQL